MIQFSFKELMDCDPCRQGLADALKIAFDYTGDIYYLPEYITDHVFTLEEIIKLHYSNTTEIQSLDLLEWVTDYALPNTDTTELCDFCKELVFSIVSGFPELKLEELISSTNVKLAYDIVNDLWHNHKDGTTEFAAIDIVNSYLYFKISGNTWYLALIVFEFVIHFPEEAVLDFFRNNEANNG